MPSTGLRPEPVLPVMPVTNRRVSVSPSASSGTLASSVAVAKQPGCATWRRGRFAQMLRDGAGEFADSRRRAMRMLVHGLVGGGARIAEVGGDIDAMHAVPAASAARQQTIDEGGGHAMGCRRKQRAAWRAADQRLDLLEPVNFKIRIGAAQMRESAGHRRAGLAVRQDGGHFELPDDPRSAAATRRPHSRCRPARSQESQRSFAGYFGFTHMRRAQAAR